MDSDRQLALFTDRELKELATPSKRRSQLMQMDSDCLQEWRKKVFRHQQQARTNVPEKQAALFDDSSAPYEPDTIDPFSLNLQSLSFWRFPTDSSGDACLYFVIDNALPLLLYVGETSRSNQRWKGVHDCKRYVENYQSLHYQHQIKTAVCIAFWWNAPMQTRPRQLLEQALIQKWRSPFNYLSQFNEWYDLAKAYGIVIGRKEEDDVILVQENSRKWILYKELSKKWALDYLQQAVKGR